MAIVVALGANARGRFGPPRRTLEAAAGWLNEGPLRLRALSRTWRCAPFGVGGQPSFRNAAALIETELSPRDLLNHLKMLENRAGRRRGRAWGPRALDLDLIDYHDMARRPAGMGGQGGGRAAHLMQKRGLVLPHPGLAERAFVLAPLAEIAPRWRHPLNGRSARQMLAMLPGKIRASCRPL